MSEIGVVSVQLGNCTDGFAANKNIFPSKTTYNPLQTHYHHRSTSLEGLAHRTLHPLWQTWMQVHRYPRAWSQILSVGQLSWTQTRTRICTSEIPSSGRGVSQQLSDGQANLRRNLEYQSRAAATEKYAVRNTHGCPAELLNVDRDRGFCNLRSKYASGVAGRTIGRSRHMGGDR
jgi:hypothetical protein